VAWDVLGRAGGRERRPEPDGRSKTGELLSGPLRGRSGRGQETGPVGAAGWSRRFHVERCRRREGQRGRPVVVRGETAAASARSSDRGAPFRSAAGAQARPIDRQHGDGQPMPPPGRLRLSGGAGRRQGPELSRGRRHSGRGRLGKAHRQHGDGQQVRPGRSGFGSPGAQGEQARSRTLSRGPHSARGRLGQAQLGVS